MSTIRVASTRQKVTEIVKRHAKFKNSYFWGAPLRASERRWMEKMNSTTFQFRFNNCKYEIDQNVRCSCRYVYYKLFVYVDGTRKDVRALKAII